MHPTRIKVVQMQDKQDKTRRARGENSKGASDPVGTRLLLTLAAFYDGPSTPCVCADRATTLQWHSHATARSQEPGTGRPNHAAPTPRNSTNCAALNHGEERRGFS
jgi:hypothetical protein